ncbi:MAG TPA: sugar ABC transporter substrate-binding protein [Chloroflexota bacterium]|nr:sugar ABC transporter substrate-binding protein [Chloroflexota bacterium]
MDTVTRRHAGALGLGAGLAPLGVLPAACGPGAAPAPARGGGEVRFLSWAGTWTPPMAPMFEQYQARTGTKITVEMSASQTQHNEKLAAQLAAGTPPDAVLSVSQVDTKHYDSGAMLNLQAFVQRDKLNLRRDYALMGTEFWCDKLFGLPWHASPSAIFYNKTMLREAGVDDPWADGKADWTWDDLAATARRVVRPAQGDDPGRWGVWWPYGNITYFGPHIWASGADFVDWERTRWTLDAPGALEGFQRYSTWLVRERFAISEPEATRVAQQYSGKDLFSAGKVAFRFRLIDDVFTYLRTVGSDFEWDVLPVPRSGSRPGVGVHAAHPHIIPAQTNVPDQAYEFIKFISGPEMQEFIGRNRITLPGLKAKMSTFLDPPPVAHARVFSDVYTRPYGIHFRHHNTFENWDQYGAVITPLLLGERPLAAGLRELNEQMNARVAYGSCAPYKGLKHPIQP